MLPKISKFDVFDDMFDDHFFTKKEMQLMKTDIKEKNGNYILEMDLPGYNKENISIELNDGYLTITAEMTNDIDESDEEANYIHKERYSGKCSRSFYVGENVSEEDINASFKNGILNIIVPKEEKNEHTKKHIEISD